MRKHKFKAWSIPEKRWINLNGFCISFNGCDDEGAVYEVTEQGVLHVIAVEDVKLVEWTGLIDKNGKEIYESDLVKGEHRSHEDWAPIQKVTYFNGCYMFGNWNAQEYFSKHTKIEVTGNIFENADLKGESQ